MLSALQQQRVWDGMLGAEIRSNYFADLSAGYYKRQKIATWAILFVSSGAAVSVLASLPDWAMLLRPVLTLTTAGLSGYSLVMQNQKLAVDAADLHARWDRFAKAYRNLWDDMYADDALDTLKKLEDMETDLSKSGVGLFAYDKSSMLRWQDHVEQQHHLVGV